VCFGGEQNREGYEALKRTISTQVGWGRYSVVWWWGEKRSILRFLLRLLLEKCLIGMAFHPKEVSMARAILMHAIGVSVVGASNLYPLKVRQK